MTPAGLDQYESIENCELFDDASPHRVTQIMFETLTKRIAEAKGHIERGEIEAKGTKIAKAIALVEGLIMSLDHERGGEIARNLQDLYDYMSRTLLSANLENNAAKLEELVSLVSEIKSGWDAIDGTVPV